MKRRDFVKSMGLFGSAVLIPSMLGGRGLISDANALGISQRKLINARAFVVGEVDYVKPTVMPQVINIFLYGGPSELGGNLTNIREINEGSPNKYDTDLVTDEGEFGTTVTHNQFWGGGANGAGGEVMEDMVARGRLTVLRTLYRTEDDSRSHRPSIFSNLTGLMGTENDRPGIATNLASVLAANNVISEDAVFPFVTFEGDSVVFNRGDTLASQNLKAISLDRDLNNPYKRNDNSTLSSEQDQIIEALAQTVANAGGSQYQKVNEAFAKRKEIEVFINDLDERINTGNQMPLDPDFVATAENPTAPRLEYPNTNFGRRLRAAVNLLIGNPDTLFVSLGSGGLGGWDDHDSALDDYPGKLRNLMNALNIATKHLEAIGKANVIINVYGDFGRNVHLNDSLGWDHGNNQNLFTAGANPETSNTGGVAGHELGKIIGKTESYFEGSVRQYTRPTEGSYTAQPFAVASTVYQDFGIQNPQIMTDNIDPIDFVSPANEWMPPPPPAE